MSQANTPSRPRSPSGVSPSAVDVPQTLLGGLSATQFMRRYWQKKPLLVRQAVPGFQPLLSRAELFALPQRDDVESRLVVQTRFQAAAAPGGTQRSARERTAKTGSAQAELASVQDSDREVRKTTRKASSSATGKSRPAKAGKSGRAGKGKATSAGKGSTSASADTSAVTRSAKPRRTRS